MKRHHSKFSLGEILFIIGLLAFLPALGAAKATRRGVRWSYVFLTLAILALITRIIWVAVEK